MSDPLWRSHFNFGHFLLFLLIGILCVALFAPIGRAIHTLGHSLGAMATSCRWIGVHAPIYDHGLALLNYPTFKYGGTYAALWYWMGGFLALVVAVVILFFFPFPPGFIGQLLPRLACLHILVTAGFLPVVETLDTLDLYIMADILHIPLLVLAGLFLFGLTTLFVIVFHLLLRLPGASLKMTATHRILFTFAIWTLPLLLFATLGFLFANWEGFPLITGAILALFPLLLAPLFSSAPVIFPKPRWTGMIATLLVSTLILLSLYMWTFRSPGDLGEALLWGRPSTSNNIPTSLTFRRLYR